MRLGINIDHVATLRNARGGAHPDPLRAALMVADAGGDLITAHLREDRRHMRDADMQRLRHECPLPLNMEMAVTAEMEHIALRLKPFAVCLVPEKRQEITTEGGLDVVAGLSAIAPCVKKLQDAGIQVSLFIDADEKQIEAARTTGAKAIEFHTGAYAHGKNQATELKRLQDGARQAHALGFSVHAGHGLDFDNVSAVAAIKEMSELNIGHFLMGEAIFTGLPAAITHMKKLMCAARP